MPVVPELLRGLAQRDVRGVESPAPNVELRRALFHAWPFSASACVPARRLSASSSRRAFSSAYPQLNHPSGNSGLSRMAPTSAPRRRASPLAPPRRASGATRARARPPETSSAFSYALSSSSASPSAHHSLASRGSSARRRRTTSAAACSSPAGPGRPPARPTARSPRTAPATGPTMPSAIRQSPSSRRRLGRRGNQVEARGARARAPGARASGSGEVLQNEQRAFARVARARARVWTRAPPPPRAGSAASGSARDQLVVATDHEREPSSAWDLRTVTAEARISACAAAGTKGRRLSKCFASPSRRTTPRPPRVSAP